MSFEKEYSERKEKFESYFNNFKEQLSDIPEPLLSSMKYSLSSGGKRLRPILLLETAKIFGAGETESLYKTACAIECVHTYSLIHDDLPCMDNSDTRRGKPSNHIVYGEGVAVLAGDALLNIVYELLFEAISLCEENLKPRYVRAGKMIADSIGSKGLIAGQIMDIAVDTAKHVSTRLNYIYQHKTADLISAALMAGAIIGGASEVEIKRIKEFGDNFGYSFQIVDDLLDEEDETDKNTFVGVYGKKEAKRAISDRTAMALTQLSSSEKDVEFLRSLVKHLSIRKN